MILCDAGFLICLADSEEPESSACRSLIGRILKPLMTTWPCVTETLHLLGRRRGGWNKQRIIAGFLRDNLIGIYEVRPEHYERLFFLMEQYQDRPMDLADASLVLAAEKTGARQILTLDSDFLFYRINNRDSFKVIAI